MKNLIVQALCAALMVGCGASQPVAPQKSESTQEERFVDRTLSWGVDFRHQVVAGGSWELPEIMGSGLAVFDANGDGHLDLYFCDASGPSSEGAPNRLWLGLEGGGFEELANAGGLNDRGYGTGVAVGDIDNDGDIDVYLGQVGRDRLYLNDGQGRFEASTQVFRNTWTSSVAMVDFDLDGRLDIFATHYVDAAQKRQCSLADGRRDYCSPHAYEGVVDALYRNLGEGQFEDSSAHTGLSERARHGLGVRIHDFDRDGWPDIFVANDGEENSLWRNLRGKKFEDVGLARGFAVNAEGNPEASMGLALGDVDRDGDLDWLATHLRRESHTLYLDEGGLYSDGTGRAGLHAGSLADTGFGTVFFDADGDGDLDLAVANGRVGLGPRVAGDEAKRPWRGYAERNRIFRNDGTGRFRDATDEMGEFGDAIEISRALVAVDLDGDGDQDLVVTNSSGPARIYEQVGRPTHWLAIDARLEDGKRRAYGATISILCSEGSTPLCRTVGSDLSYLSSVDAPALFQIPAEFRPRSIVVTWPGGEPESFAIPGLAQKLQVIRGSGGQR